MSVFFLILVLICSSRWAGKTNFVLLSYLIETWRNVFVFPIFFFNIFYILFFIIILQFNSPVFPVKQSGHLSASMAEQLLNIWQRFNFGRCVNQLHCSFDVQRSRQSYSSEENSASSWKLSMHWPLSKQGSIAKLFWKGLLIVIIIEEYMYSHH